MAGARTKDWFTHVFYDGDHRVSVVVDLAFGSIAPITKKPWRITARIHLQSPREDGLHDSAEAQTLYAIEDALIERLAAVCSGLFPGSFTIAGKLLLFFYAETEVGGKEAVNEIAASFPSHRIDVAINHDAEWRSYFDLLYPSEEQIECGKNMDVLATLAEAGDVHELPREVCHWASFKTDVDRAAFREMAATAGFSFIQADEREDYPTPYAITIARTQPITLDMVNATTLELLALAKSWHGEYEGWEAKITGDKS